MKAQSSAYLLVALALTLASVAHAADPKPAAKQHSPQSATYVITNDDQQFPFENQLSIMQVTGTDNAPDLVFQELVNTGGYGSLGGFFASSRLNTVANADAKCLYASNSADGTIAALTLDTLQLVDVFSGSQSDSGDPDGIGLVLNAGYLYAGYTASKTIGVFATSPGCGLTFLQDVPAAGLHGGSPTGMAVNANILVVAYGDGSIQSFNVSNGVPVPNNDLQNSSGFAGPNALSAFATGNLPSGVDLTSDGKFAIFGDISNATVVEVSRISNGKLTRTIPYKLGNRVDAGTVRLSPDEKLLYIVNSEGGAVTAAFFDKATGVLTPGCVSPTLRGYNSRTWFGELAMRDNTGTGTVLYVAEFGRFTELHNPPSAIGMLTVAVNGNSCTLSEAPSSPFITGFPGMLSLGAYPPRTF